MEFTFVTCDRCNPTLGVFDVEPYEYEEQSGAKIGGLKRGIFVGNWKEAAAKGWLKDPEDGSQVCPRCLREAADPSGGEEIPYSEDTEEAKAELEAKIRDFKLTPFEQENRKWIEGSARLSGLDGFTKQSIFWALNQLPTGATDETRMAVAKKVIDNG